MPKRPCGNGVGWANRSTYALDDLPDQLRAKNSGGPSRTLPGGETALPELASPGVRIESLGIPPKGLAPGLDTLGLIRAAAEDCFCRSAYSRDEVGLLIFAGVYRSEFLSEPAGGALAAGDLRINGDIATLDGPRTFAFDVLNGGVGFLNACHVASALIRAGKQRVAMVVASEVENNRPGGPASPAGILETGTAAILDAAPDGGFRAFLFNMLSSSLVHSMQYAIARGMATGGDLGLVIVVGSGIQVGCALYRF